MTEVTEYGELVRLPSGLRVYYEDEAHAYYRCKDDGGRGRRYTGVTTIIRPADWKPDGLMKWAARLNCIGVARLVERALEATDIEAARTELHWLTGEDEHAIWDVLTAEGLTYDDLRDEKAATGTRIHEIVLQALAQGSPVPDLESLNDEEHGYAEAVMDFWLDHAPQVEACEQIVADADLGIAGRLDLIANLRPCDDDLCPCRAGGLGLIDLKTGTYQGNSHHIQIALYAHLARLCGVAETDYGAVLYVAADGTYRLVRCRATPEDALAVVDVYRRIGALGNAARKDREARK